MRLRMNLWAAAPHRMETKIHLASLTVFLFVMFKVSSTQTPSTADLMEPVTGVMENTQTVETIGSVDLSRVTRDVVDSSPKTEAATKRPVSTSSPANVSKTSSAATEKTPKPQPELTSTQASTTTSTRSISEKTTTKKTTTKDTSKAVWDPKWDEAFSYGHIEWTKDEERGREREREREGEREHAHSDTETSPSISGKTLNTTQRHVCACGPSVSQCHTHESRIYEKRWNHHWLYLCHLFLYFPFKKKKVK
ncbi:FXYD domain containing ion transport regulator 5 isoform X1 [Limanda limanda]|uniref:FXYD domain containing ion transport regulator 5 isoform X1 n=1 Tax=Limanda limanda TaxID=27771 RepID=UPI0029C828BD|nr:FXYD domain containing ion transport regulator 5 isoform X1 [Limanda limanda]